ncbi:uncharacterized protein LOC129745927 isoform X2 [Uranotaenia lowii]|uniref:uncharacterized protein LOC129745927 isoform X2 n=1 Tax=Uranotaenia lowii TaxID=190385 RepID=UPI0024789DE2|nr:uncharacterized protein LOC129745927 isoform X2 [Uranotaenia lowii]
MARRRVNKRNQQDHVSYVQQLFKNFLDSNRKHRSNIPHAQPNPIQRPVDRFNIDVEDYRPNLYQQEVMKNVRLAQKNPTNQRNLVQKSSYNDDTSFGGAFKKPNAVPSNPIQRFLQQPVGRPPVDKHLNQPTYARFKRQQGSDQFHRRPPSPTNNKGGLIQWLESRKKARIENDILARKNKRRKAEQDEYLNLPDGFFSGQEIQIPFQLNKTAADKTMTSVALSRFVPPMASTPFEEPDVLSSPILSDPDELIRAPDKQNHASQYQRFLGQVERELQKLNLLFDESESKKRFLYRESQQVARENQSILTTKKPDSSMSVCYATANKTIMESLGPTVYQSIAEDDPVLAVSQSRALRIIFEVF